MSPKPPSSMHHDHTSPPPPAFLSLSTAVIPPFLRRPTTRRRPRTSTTPLTPSYVAFSAVRVQVPSNSQLVCRTAKQSNTSDAVDDNDATEHFDFIRQNQAPSRQSSSLSSSDPLNSDDSIPTLPPLVPSPSSSSSTDKTKTSPVFTSESDVHQSQSPSSSSFTNSNPNNSNIKLNTSSNMHSDTNNSNSNVRILIASPGLGRLFFERTRRETMRALSESDLMSMLRLPSRRETITMAGEVAVVIAVLLLLRAGVSSVLRWVHARVTSASGQERRSTGLPYEASVFECMQRPLEFLSVFTVGTALAEVVSRPLAATGLVKQIRSVRELGVIIAATWFLLRWIDRIRTRFATDKRIDKSQVDATARFATVATFVVSLLISLDTLGVNVQAVLAFGGIGGVAIGFAGKEIISNFFGGCMIYVTRPFTVGEWIRCIEETQLNGTVEDIGWYLTRVRTWDKRPLYIPNSRFSTLIVENGSRMDNRRIVHTLHLRLEDVPVVRTIVKQMEQVLMQHPDLDPRQHRLVYVDSFDDYSINLWFSCYTKSVFLYDFRNVQQQLLLKFYDIIRDAGAQLASRNTRDVRPGANTDRYGPFGPYAAPPLTDDNTTQQNNAPSANDADELGTVAHIDNIPYSMVDHNLPLDQRKMMEHPNPNPNFDTSVPAAAPSTAGNTPSTTPAPSASSPDAPKPKTDRLSSDAAITAVVGALAAARRIASRRQSTSPSAATSSDTKSSSSTSNGPGVAGSSTAGDGSAKGTEGNSNTINSSSSPGTVATPAGATTTYNGSNATGNAVSGDDKNVSAVRSSSADSSASGGDGNASAPAPAASSGGSSGSGGVSTAQTQAQTPSQPQGQMKITKAPSASSGLKSTPPPASSVEDSSGGNGKVKSGGTGPNASAGGASQQMKISGEASADKDERTDTDKDTTSPSSSSPSVTTPGAGSGGVAANEASAGAGGSTSGGGGERSGQMKISGTAKPKRVVNPGGDGGGSGPPSSGGGVSNNGNSTGASD